MTGPAGVGPLGFNRMISLASTASMRGFKLPKGWPRYRGDGMTDQPITAEFIDSLKTPRAGWTKESLSRLGVPWPPPKGWRKRLIKGANT